MTVHGRTLALIACALGATASASLAVAGPPRAGGSATRSAPHLVVVPDTAEARVALGDSDARTIAGYGAFTLVEATGRDVGRLVAAGGDLRDDMREVRTASGKADPAVARPSLLDKTGAQLRRAGRGAGGLALVQYAGPLKDDWIGAVGKTGVRVVTYMAQNAQLVSGDDAQLAALAQLLTKARFIRAVTPYTAADKQLPGLQAAGRSEVVVSTVAGAPGDAARAAIAKVSDRRGDRVTVAGIDQQRVALDGAEIAGLAELGGVVAIEPRTQPKLLDERAAQIVAGNLNGAFQPVLGTGYRAFLAANGFTTNNALTIDVTDEGVDKGVVPAPAGSHLDFYLRGSTANPHRLRYAQEATAADANARDCGGHGTNVAAIAAGYNARVGSTVEDAQGFNYGQGIAPYGRIGATKIFNCGGNFDVTTSLTALHSNAYANGARISNNSWGAAVGGAYTADSREFDGLVRDVQPGVAGRQGFTEVLSAGNNGSGGNTIGAPGTAKNVITVGASENVRAIGAADGCGVTDAHANSARDIVDFSSRGPTDDGRIKPDVAAPGTHVSGAQPQTGADYNGGGTCNEQFPAGSALYTLASGTSQAAPEVSGLAALVDEHFRTTFGGGTRHPSPAMTKALIVNTASDLVGGDNGAGGTNANVPTQIQGWGRVNLGEVVDGTDRQVVDQSAILSTTGGSSSRFYDVSAPAQLLRVTLAWTDPPGPTAGNAFVNDLDLEVTAGGQTYKGNAFSGGSSVSGGAADPRNNLENVFLPAGVSGKVKVRVVAKNLAGDGVPGAGDTTDQDYALVVSNVGPQLPSAPALVDEGHTVTLAAGQTVPRPGRPFLLLQRLRNLGNAPATSISGTMTAPASDATITQASSAWPNLGPNALGSNNPRFRGVVNPALTCGDDVHLTIQVSSNAGPVTLPVTIRTGATTAPTAQSSTDVPKAIPDNNVTGVNSTLAVTASGMITDLDVTIGSLTHPFDADLVISLVSPAGTTVRLANHNGSGGDNFTDTVFDDAAAIAVSSGSAPFTGPHRPFDPLSAFNGQQVNGTWTVNVTDTAPADVGSLNSWGVARSLFDCS